MNGGLWRDHKATPNQTDLAFRKGHTKSNRPTQADLLVAMLRDARIQDSPVGLPEIMAAGIAQHGARFNELRSRGFVIENELSREGDILRSCYWLRFDPERDSPDGR